MTEHLRKKARSLEGCVGKRTQGRDEDNFSEFQRSRNDGSAHLREIVFALSGDFLDDAVNSESFQQPGGLGGGFAREEFSQSAVGEPVDEEFAADDRIEEVEVFAVKNIEPSECSVAVCGGTGDFIECFDVGRRVVNGGDEIEVAAVGGGHDFGKRRQAVDGFLHRGEFHFPCAVAVFHPSVVKEETDIVGGDFHAQDDAHLVIHLDGCFSHVVFDARALDACVEVVADFTGVVAVEFAAQECGDIVRLDAVDRGADEFFIERLEVLAAFEDDVCGVFHLHDAPVAAAGEMPQDGAVLRFVAGDDAVQSAHVECVGKARRLFHVADVHERVVEHIETGPGLAQFRRQFVVPVEIELEAEWRPGGHAQVAQPQRRVDEVEVVVEALCVFVSEKSLVRFFCRAMARTRGMLPSPKRYARDPDDRLSFR